MDAAPPPSPPLPPPELPPAPIAPPTSPVDPEGFVARCEDCRYDLSGLADGKCPECGLPFTRDALRYLFTIRERARLQRRNAAPRVLLGTIAILSSLLCGLGLRVGTAALLAAWTLGLAAWLAHGRRTWPVGAHLLVLYLVPLLLFAIVHAATPYGLPVVAVAAILACAVSYTALRHEPLRAAFLIAILMIAPALLLSAALWLMSASRAAAGHHWTDFDYPTPTGWQAIPAPQGLRAAVWLLGLASAVAVVVAFYARRVAVRLRARSKRPEAV